MNWLKSIFTLSLVTTSVGMALPAIPGFKIDAKDVIRIEIGTDDDDAPMNGDRTAYLVSANRELRRRVHRLEQALRQMQDQMYRLEESNYRAVAAVQLQPAKEYTCYLQTSWDGTVYGKGGSEVEARAKALQSCGEKGRGFCNDRDVKCGS